MPDSSEQRVVLIGGRVGSGDATPTPGSFTIDCSQCKQPVWIAPSSKHVLDQGAEVMCNDCVRPLAKQAAEAGQLQVGSHPGQAMIPSIRKMLKLLSE